MPPISAHPTPISCFGSTVCFKNSGERSSHGTGVQGERQRFAIRKGSKMTLSGMGSSRAGVRVRGSAGLRATECTRPNFELPVFSSPAWAGKQRRRFEGRQAIDEEPRAAQADGRQPSGPHRTSRCACGVASRAVSPGRMRRRRSGRHIAKHRRLNLVERFLFALARGCNHRHQLHRLQREQFFRPL